MATPFTSGIFDLFCFICLFAAIGCATTLVEVMAKIEQQQDRAADVSHGFATLYLYRVMLFGFIVVASGIGAMTAWSAK